MMRRHKIGFPMVVAGFDRGAQCRTFKKDSKIRNLGQIIGGHVGDKEAALLGGKDEAFGRQPAKRLSCLILS